MEHHHQMSGPTWMWMPSAPPTWANLFAWHPQPVPLSLIIAFLGIAAYTAGVIRMKQRGLAWPVLNTVAFSLGMAAMVLMLGTGINGYGMWLFSVHMVQHMVLSMITPILVLLGRPTTLALRALNAQGRPRGWLLAVLHSRFARVVTSPFFSIPMFVFTLYGIYFTPLFDILMNNWVGHEFMLVHFVVSGLALYWPVLGLDPSPHLVTPPLALLESLIPQPFHAFFAVTVMDANSLIVTTFANPPASWGINPLADQELGGGLAWGFTEIPGLMVTLVIGWMWFRSSQREAKRHDRDEDRTGDQKLADYNRYLESLQEQP